MNDQNKAIKNDSTACVWCGKNLNIYDIQTVCGSCFKLLNRANISDEEIFGKNPENSNKNAEKIDLF